MRLGFELGQRVIRRWLPHLEIVWCTEYKVEYCLGEDYLICLYLIAERETRLWEHERWGEKLEFDDWLPKCLATIVLRMMWLPIYEIVT
jgi:hypothetical protein